jgi:hypothetical protein
MSDSFNATPSRCGDSNSGDCRWVQEHLHAFVEGEAAPLLVRLMDKHLRGCSSCVAELAALQNERIGLIESFIEAPRLPSDFAARVTRRIDRAERIALRRHHRAWLLRLSAAAAALLILGFFTASFFRSPPESKPVTPIAGVRTPGESFQLGPAPGMQAAELAPELRSNVRPELPSTRAVDNVQFAVFTAPRVSSFRHVVDMAHRIAPDARKPENPLKDDPCKPDPNKDGRTDITDVAYSCQVLLAGQRVVSASFAMDSAPTSLDPTPVKATEAVDCDESCYRA